ncbi:hypothetical protein RM779_12645 [Streptomyces sp. DSM 41886]|uniref:Integrase n=1 Tax=Streptomyces johnsoniae TaxID=3075532 RepID=A0ABU2S3F1_9ACTN|nr:hypothetical protein [Streptomyces sp. DSM 41886]MDT0443437.1 hypothetical protein [Streptomyces sp. DSM 41886]
MPESGDGRGLLRYGLVGKRKYSKSYALKAQADGRRSELMAAVRKDEQFDTETGLPVSEMRAMKLSVTWYQHSRTFADSKWDALPAKSRRNVDDALATITPALVKEGAGMPEQRLLRRALYGWAYNKSRRDQQPPEDCAKALEGMEKHSLPVAELADTEVLRKALDALARKLDGKPAAGRTAKRKRACLSDALGLAVEKKLLPNGINPLKTIRWAATPARSANSSLEYGTRASAVSIWRRSSGACTTPPPARPRPST